VITDSKESRRQDYEAQNGRQFTVMEKIQAAAFSQFLCPPLAYIRVVPLIRGYICSTLRAFYICVHAMSARLIAGLQ
jgi:hypothetical protein